MEAAGFGGLDAGDGGQGWETPAEEIRSRERETRASPRLSPGERQHSAAEIRKREGVLRRQGAPSMSESRTRPGAQG